MVNILVVDDEPDLRFILRRIFEGAGHKVTEAWHGAAALDAIAAAPPDLVVTDMMMPVMGGAELIRRLRDEPATARIPIMAVSGDPHLAGRADTIVPKPFNKRDLLFSLDGLLNWQRRSPDERTTDRRARPGRDSPRRPSTRVADRGRRRGRRR